MPPHHMPGCSFLSSLHPRPGFVSLVGKKMCVWHFFDYSRGGSLLHRIVPASTFLLWIMCLPRI